MVEISNKKEPQDNLEDLVFETRFLFNVLIDLLLDKKVITNEELQKKYEQVLNEAEQKQS